MTPLNKPDACTSEGGCIFKAFQASVMAGNGVGRGSSSRSGFANWTNTDDGVDWTFRQVTFS